jgi:hypothetical protein
VGGVSCLRTCAGFLGGSGYGSWWRGRHAGDLSSRSGWSQSSRRSAGNSTRPLCIHFPRGTFLSLHHLRQRASGPRGPAEGGEARRGGLLPFVTQTFQRHSPIRCWCWFTRCCHLRQFLAFLLLSSCNRHRSSRRRPASVRISRWQGGAPLDIVHNILSMTPFVS